MEEQIGKILLITDLLDAKSRKEEELAFYTHQLELLEAKLNSIRHEINLTTVIIKMIEKEKIYNLDYLRSDFKPD